MWPDDERVREILGKCALLTSLRVNRPFVDSALGLRLTFTLNYDRGGSARGLADEPRA